MEENNISQRQLATSMGVTPGRVSQILSGDENLTLRTLAAVCVGLAVHFEVDLVSNDQAQEVPLQQSARLVNGQDGQVTRTPVPSPRRPVDEPSLPVAYLPEEHSAFSR
jgi:transcriptional regulator with XRE-family HTH domain